MSNVVGRLCLLLGSPNHRLNASVRRRWNRLRSGLSMKLRNTELRGWRRGRSVAIMHSTGAGDTGAIRTHISRWASRRAEFLPTRDGYDGAVDRSQDARPPRAQRRGERSVGVDQRRRHPRRPRPVVADRLRDRRRRRAAEFCIIGAVVDGFRRLGVFDRGQAFDACRPFQEGSRAFYLVEAAVAMVLMARADEPYAVIPRRRRQSRRVPQDRRRPNRRRNAALLSGGTLRSRDGPSEVAYVNAHGTGTSQNDTVKERRQGDLRRRDRPKGGSHGVAAHPPPTLAGPV